MDFVESEDLFCVNYGVRGVIEIVCVFSIDFDFCWIRINGGFFCY